MRVLFISDRVSDLRAPPRLAAAGHGVEIAKDGRAAKAFLAHERFDVVLLDWSLGTQVAAEVVRSIRASELDGYTYVVAVLATPSPTTITSAFQAGADDVLRSPIVVEELVGRLGALDRIRRWSARVGASGGVSHDFSGKLDPSSLRAWQEARCIIGADFQGVLGHELVGVGTGTAEPCGLAAEIPLTNAVDGVDVCMLVTVGESSIRTMSETVFGTVVDASAQHDMVRELANTAAGAFKRAALLEGVTLTTGLPVDVTFDSAGVGAGLVAKDLWLELSGTSARVRCRLFVRSRMLERLAPAQLSEGMVLARDLMSDAGVLLAPSGTRLTEATIHRLSRLLAATSVVEIAKAA